MPAKGGERTNARLCQQLNDALVNFLWSETEQRRLRITPGTSGVPPRSPGALRRKDLCIEGLQAASSRNT